MKKSLILGIAAGMLLFFSCKNHKPEPENHDGHNQSAMESSKTTGVDTLKMLNVSFISIGEGVDFEAAGKFKMFIDGSTFAEKLAMEEFRWGREGEIDYCMNLSNITSSEKAGIIAKVNELMQSSKLIRLEYNLPCRNKRQ